MFELTFFVPVLIVAGVWGYILLNIAGNNRRFLKDDILCANEKQRKEAESTMRAIHLLAPIWFFVVAIAVVFLINAYYPFIRLSLTGVALIAGGLLFTYIGWSVGMAIRGNEDNPGDENAKFFSKVFMISFMGAGIFVTVIGVIVCTPQLARFF